MGGQSGVAVTRSHGNGQDVVSNPATARNEKQTLETGSQWKTGDVKPN